MKQEKCLKIIKKNFTKNIKSYKVINNSYANVVIEVNDNLMFRFSKEKRDIEQMQIEQDFLPKFIKKSSIPVPDVKYKGKNYIAYRKLEGSPLEKKHFTKLSERKKEKIWKSIGNFLSELHSIDYKHKNLVKYPYGDDDFWNDLWEPIKKDLTLQTRKKAYKYFENFFKKIQYHNIPQTICHADFHPNHILYNESQQKISGIIDFGRISLNDPAVDFNLIERFFGKKAVNTILKYYSVDAGDYFKERITFQNRRRQLAAIFYAKITGFDSEIPRYIERIEKIRW